MNSDANIHDSPLVAFLPWKEFLEQGYGGRIFRSAGAILWFMREHADELERSGVLIKRRGQGGHLLHLKRFPEVALDILRREAAA